jgi:HK97 family phage prohead protease
MGKIETRKSYDLFKLKEEEILDKQDGLNGKRRYISGYAIVFNELSVDLGGFREIILPESADRQMINESDILMPVNHNRDNGLPARSKFGTGSLRIEVDEKGVYFEFELPNTQPGNDMYELIRRGDISQTSFSFTIPPGGDEIIEESTGIVRQVKKIDRLCDFSIVDFPAYEDTFVEAAKRSVEAYRERKEKEEGERDKKSVLTKKDVRMRLLKNSLYRKYNLKQLEK